MREPPVSENEITSSKSSRGASESADSIGDATETTNTTSTSNTSTSNIKLPSTGVSSGGTGKGLEDDRSTGQPENEPEQKVNRCSPHYQNKDDDHDDDDDDDQWCFDTVSSQRDTHRRSNNNNNRSISSCRTRQRYGDEEDVLLGRYSVPSPFDSRGYHYGNPCDGSDSEFYSDCDHENNDIVGGDEDRCFLDNQPTCTMGIESPDKDSDRGSISERKQSVGSSSAMDENSNSSMPRPPSRPESRGSDMLVERSISNHGVSSASLADMVMKSASRDHQQRPPVPSSHFTSPPPSAQPLTSSSSSSFSNVPNSAYINNLLNSKSGQSPAPRPSSASPSSFQPHPGLPSYMPTPASTASSVLGGHANPPKSDFGGGAGRIGFPMNNSTYPSPFTGGGVIGGKGQMHHQGSAPMDRGVAGMSLSNNLSEFLPKSGVSGIPHSSNEQWKGMFAMPNSGESFPPHPQNAMQQPMADRKMMFSPPSSDNKKKTPEKGNLDNNSLIANNNDGSSTDRRGTPSPFTNSSPSSRNVTTPVPSSSPSSSSVIGGGGRQYSMLPPPGAVSAAKKQESLSAAATAALNKGMPAPPSASIPGATSSTGATGGAPGKVVSIHPGSPQYHQIFIYQHQLLIMQFQQYQFQLQAQFQQLRIQQMSQQQMAMLSQQFHQQMMLLQQQFNQQQVCNIL